MVGGKKALIGETPGDNKPLLVKDTNGLLTGMQLCMLTLTLPVEKEDASPAEQKCPRPRDILRQFWDCSTERTDSHS